MKRILMAACLLVVTGGLVWAGETTTKGTTTSAAKLAAMKAEMSKCAVCKNMAVHLDEIGTIRTEVVKLNNGAAILHTVSPAKAEIFHQAGNEVAKAGGACMSMTDDQAK